MKYCNPLIIAILMLSTSFTCVSFSQSKPTSNNWGVVYSSDDTLQTAKYEIDRLPIRLPQYSKQARLFKRKNWFVSVVLFSNAEEAKKARNVIDNEYSRGVFVVNIGLWCNPNWVDPKYTKKGLIDCNKVEIAPNKTGAIIIPIKDWAEAKKALSTVKDKLDKLINTGQNSAFVNIEQDVTIFRRGNSFYIAVINYADLSAAEKAVRNTPGDKFYNDFAPVDLKEWCGTYENKPNKNGYIQCQKSK